MHCEYRGEILRAILMGILFVIGVGIAFAIALIPTYQ